MFHTFTPVEEKIEKKEFESAEGPAKFTFTSYTDQFKYDAERSNFDTYKTWYTELNKWTDHLTDVDKAN